MLAMVELEEVSTTVAPAAGAKPFRAMLQVSSALEAIVLDAGVSEARLAGITVMVVDALKPSAVAVNVTGVFWATPRVFMGVEMVVAPVEPLSVVGIDAAAELFVERVTDCVAVLMGPSSVTLPVICWPDMQVG
jgi:hypothetical protein